MKRYLKRTLKEELNEDDIDTVIYHTIKDASPIRDNVLDIAKNVIDRVSDYSNEDDLYQALSDELIYDDDLWTIFRYYSDSVEDADWLSAYDRFYSDLVQICNELAELSEEDDYEDEEEVEEEE